MSCSLFNTKAERIRFALVLVLFIASFSASLSQNLSSIKGRIFDAKTKEYLPGATVYLANTAIGVAANTDGTFFLTNILSGKYDLTVSMIGYKTFSKPTVFDGSAIPDFSVYLEQKTEELKSVLVTAKRSNNRIYFSEFKKLFLGQTQNSYGCKIINLNDIFVYKEESKLYAVAYKPIEVENKALGYRVIYELKEFVIDYVKNTVTLSGIPRFENLVPESKKQERRWIKERDRAYYGSDVHFFRSLKKKELKKNYFTIYDQNDNEINEGWLLKNNSDSVISYNGNLKIVFDGEPSEILYNKSSWQNSVINFTGNPVTIYDNGYYENFLDLILLGYIGWSNRIADMLPLGYQPSSKLK